MSMCLNGRNGWNWWGNRHRGKIATGTICFDNAGSQWMEMPLAMFFDVRANHGAERLEIFRNTVLQEF